MRMTLKSARCIAALSLILVAGSASATSVMAQDPTATVAVEEIVSTPVVEEDDSFDDWGLLGLLGLAGLAGLLRKPKTEVQPVTRTVVEPPANRSKH